MSRRTFKFRLCPTRKQAERLTWTLERCRELYNAALQERRDAYRMAGKSLNYYDQANQLPAVKVARSEYSEIYSQVLQDVLRRVDKTFQAFFRRVKAGEKAGYPRYKGTGWYDSFTFPQLGWSLQNDRLTLSKIGTVKVRLHRAMQGKVKTVSIKREGEHWYVCFSVEVVDADATLPHSDKSVGIDLGLSTFATLSDGQRIENPRCLRKSLHILATVQQTLSRRKRGKGGSHRRAKAKKAVAQIHRRIRNQRADFLHKQSRRLVDEYGTIVFERLQPRNMVRNHSLALSISDAGWGQFVQYCSFKAESAGRSVVFVDPRYTSQTCSGCGTIQRKELSERWHSCPCGCELDRDHNAAINILNIWLGTSQQVVQVACKSPRL